MQKTVQKNLKLRFIAIVAVLIIAVVGALMVIRPTFAAVKTWTGAGGNNLFSTPGNWSGGTIPVNGDSLLFDTDDLPVFGVATYVSLQNDLTGLQLTGMTFSGTGSLGDYSIEGNPLTIEGLVENDSADSAAGGMRPQIAANLSLSNDLTLDAIAVSPDSTITTNGHDIIIGNASSGYNGRTSIGAAINGSGAIIGSNNFDYGGTGTTAGNFTGSISLATGITVVLDARRLTTPSSLTGDDNLIYLSGQYGGQVISTPVTLSGELRTSNGGFCWAGACGDGGTDPHDSFTFTNNFWLNGDLVYVGNHVDTTVTGSYITFGHALTTDGASIGTITVPAEDTAPGAPTGVTTTPSDGTVGLNWTAPASNGGQAISDYIVEYKLSASGTWDTFADGTSTATSASVTGLTDGSSYDFRVSAVNIVGTGAASTPVSAVPGELPDAPTGVSATAGNGSASVSFTPPADDGGATITGYTVTSSPGGLTATGAGSPIVVSGLTNGTSYTFTVIATTAVGDSPASSPSSAVTPATVPGAPTGVAATPGNGSASVSFTAPASNGGSAITNYTVTSSPGGFTGTGASSPIIVSGLTNGTPYTFTVVATNSVGDGTASAASSAVTPATVPGAPTGLTATAGDSTVDLSWTAPASNGGSAINDYIVQYKLSSSGTWLAFADGAGTGTTTTVTGLTNGSAYDFRVIAVNSIGQSTASTTDSETPVPDPVAPGLPRTLSSTPGDTEVDLTWLAPLSDGGSAITDYVVEYKLSASGTWLTFTDGVSAITGATVTSLTNGQSYDFRVAAVNAEGQGSFVTITGVVPAAAASTPDAPTGLGAVTDAETGDVTLGWTVPASNGGSAITGYIIEVQLSGSSTWTVIDTTPGSSTSYVITAGLVNGQTYDIRVSAVNAEGTGAGVLLTSFLYSYVDAGNPGSGGGSTDPDDSAGAPNTGVFQMFVSNAGVIALGIASFIVLMWLSARRKIAKR